MIPGSTTSGATCRPTHSPLAGSLDVGSSADTGLARQGRDPNRGPSSADPSLGTDGRARFGLDSDIADAVELCLLDCAGGERRLEMEATAPGAFRLSVPDLEAGQRYGYRVHGPWRPDEGLRCNPAKLLLDPRARAIEGDADWGAHTSGHDLDDPAQPSRLDSAAHVPHSVLVGEGFDWGDDAPPRHRWADLVIYECHVKGLTQLHPEVPRALRGSYLGLASEPVLAHLTDLGVTAVELLPVHHHLAEPFIVERGLTNYWGYCPAGWFAPHRGYAAGQAHDAQLVEFKTMVAALHRAGIEVILDVVFNHTFEGSEAGPTLGLRGIDNPGYHRLRSDRRLYDDVTGTGNSIDASKPLALRLILDSMRYWVTEMHVDGFRFDLAVTLGRGTEGFDPTAPFFTAIAADPVLSGVKLIAEPWDLGRDGYQVGTFPDPWREWNGRHRDWIRDLWRGAAEASALVQIWSGRDDDGSEPQRRDVNLVTAHDGFTLADLVAHEDKHNLANREGNRDGDSHNHSWNSGVEGPTSDPVVSLRRSRRSRSMLATLMLARGVPMILGGDEVARSQGGNNNAYCQDNETSWVAWPDGPHELTRLIAALSVLRQHPALSWDATACWFDAEGHPILDPARPAPSAHSVPPPWCVLAIPQSSSGSASVEVAPGALAVGFNPTDDAASMVLPTRFGDHHTVRLDTASGPNETAQPLASGPIQLESWSLVVVEAVAP